MRWCRLDWTRCRSRAQWASAVPSICEVPVQMCEPCATASPAPAQRRRTRRSHRHGRTSRSPTRLLRAAVFRTSGTRYDAMLAMRRTTRHNDRSADVFCLRAVFVLHFALLAEPFSGDSLGAGRAQVLPGELGSGLALWRHGARSIFDPKTSALPVLCAYRQRIACRRRMPTAHADGACRRRMPTAHAEGACRRPSAVRVAVRRWSC